MRSQRERAAGRSESSRRNGDVNHGRRGCRCQDRDGDGDGDVQLGPARPGPTGRRYNVIVVAFRLSRSPDEVKSG